MEEKKEEKENRFATIGEFFKRYIDVQGIQCFRFSLDGQCWASTKKRHARITIGLPRTIVDGNLKDLDKFAFFGIAIPRELL